MKKILNHRILGLRSWRAMLALAGLLFGFNTQVVAQYGVIETTFHINGKVISEVCNNPIKNIKVSFEELLGNEHINNYTRSVLTNDSGNFSIDLYGYYSRDKLRIIVHDADSLETVAYRDTAFIIPATANDFQKRGEGHWHMDYDYKSPLMIRLRNNGTPPCQKESLQRHSVIIADRQLIDSNNNDFIEEDTVEYDFSDNKSVNNSSPQHPLKVYPDPNEGVYTVEFESEMEADAIMSVYDSRYRLISNKGIHIIKGMNRIVSEMIEYPSGIYFLRMTGEHIKFNVKLVRN